MNSIKEILGKYEEFARTDAKLNGVVQVLRMAANLNDTLGGPETISYGIEASTKDSEATVRKKIIDFFFLNLGHVGIPRDRNDMARRFNMEIGGTLPDDFRVLALVLPSKDHIWPDVDREYGEKMSKLNSTAIAYWHRIIFQLMSADKSVERSSTRIGWFRDAGEEELINLRLGKDSMRFIKTALARSSS